MNCIIACHKPWCTSLAERLEQKSKYHFIAINEKEELTLTLLDEVKPDYVFFPHWSYIIPKEVHVKYECVIFHMTDLPYGRGGSPLQNLIVRGHQETMLSAIQCVTKLDAGPIYLKERLSLWGNAEEVYLRAAKLIEPMIIKILTEQPIPIEQKGEITTFKRRTEEQGDWSDAATLDELFDKIRMLDADGYPQAFVRVGSYKLEFSRGSRKTDCIIADVKISKVDE
jgi:methionyl-tRNA formyltransferase